ncbi:hypothetical protein JI666_20055 [Bacillus sp. NTK071]|uniref:hypothetical protein n=1 Tax=Bacillus sp. NTK071 TaxID=2802175 RepID=UPI001A8E8FC5|nr:hypothetical protein [Bacillus sp. NTK071]MBN8211038.1 hypothetical protein [Bacillus sp. NTK071]
MLKIPQNKKFRHLPDYMKVHLLFISPSNTKVVVFGFCFFLLDFCIIPLVIPINMGIFLSLTPNLLFINLWAVRLLVKNPYTTQMETVLFIGITSLIGAICYFITSMKVSYLFIGITNIWYYMMLLIIFMSITATFIRVQIEKYATIAHTLNESKKWYNNRSLLPLIPTGGGVSYILFQSTRSNELLMHTIFLFACIAMSILFSYISAKYCHKYKFMKQNSHLLII